MIAHSRAWLRKFWFSFGACLNYNVVDTRKVIVMVCGVTRKEDCYLDKLRLTPGCGRKIVDFMFRWFVKD
jgi:hypothetical protein